MQIWWGSAVLLQLVPDSSVEAVWPVGQSRQNNAGMSAAWMGLSCTLACYAAYAAMHVFAGMHEMIACLLYSRRAMSAGMQRWPECGLAGPAM